MVSKTHISAAEENMFGLDIVDNDRLERFSSSTLRVIWLLRGSQKLLRASSVREYNSGAVSKTY